MVLLLSKPAWFCGEANLFSCVIINLHFFFYILSPSGINYLVTYFVPVKTGRMKKMKKKWRDEEEEEFRGENQSVNTVEGKKKCDGSFCAPIWLAYGA